jgi:hypothetical protein
VLGGEDLQLARGCGVTSSRRHFGRHLRLLVAR